MEILRIVLLLSLLSIALSFNKSVSYNERDVLVRKARWLPLIYPRSNPAKFKVGKK